MAQEVPITSYEPDLVVVAKSRDVLRLSAFFAVAWLPALVGSNAVQSASELFHLADSAHPYFVPGHAGILYLWTPLVVMSACLLFLSPGLFLALALDAAKGVGQWVLAGFALSLVVVSAAAGIMQSIIGNPLRGIAFSAVVVGCSVLCFGFLLMLLARGRALTWPLIQPHAGATVLSIMLIPLLLLIVLTPKFYWENFNGDGVHAFESARLLLFQPFPFWPSSAGEISSFPGVTSMLFAFPASWFIRLFGETEASARLPILLYLMALYGAILTLIEYERVKPVGLAERWLIWLGLTVYVVVMAFSATYNPYFADIALPATQDTLLMVCFLGFMLGFLRREQKWMFFFTGLTFASLPNAMVLIGFWLLSVAFVWRPRPWGQIGMSIAALLSCIVIAAIGQWVLTAIHLPVPGEEYALLGFLKRFAFLQWTDWHRIAFMVVPGGILPAAALLAWRRQDHVARTLTVVTIAYFVFFYVQAHIALHHFVPAMLLPLIVFWRNNLVINSHYRPIMLACSGVAGIVALMISLPQNTAPHISARIVGSAIENRIGGYEALDPRVFRHSSILRHLFPYAWDPSVPMESYGGSPLIWYYYSHWKGGATRDVNYVIQPADHPSPTDMRLLAREDNVALYIHSDSIWADDRAIRPPTPAGSKMYEIPRGILFRSVPLEDGPSIINVVNIVESLGIEIDPLLDRLGVKR